MLVRESAVGGLKFSMAKNCQLWKSQLGEVLVGEQTRKI